MKLVRSFVLFLSAYGALSPNVACANPVRSQASANIKMPKTPHMGVDLSGCEFSSNGAQCPNWSDVVWYGGQGGFSLIRYPFKGSQIDSPTVVAKIAAAANQAISTGVPMVLDRHDYAWPSVSDQIAFWKKLMAAMPVSDLLMIDLENEPKGFNSSANSNDFVQWAQDTNAIIAGLRHAGIKNPILAEWPQWSAAFRFDKNESASSACVSAACGLDRSGGLVDPLGKTLLSPHRYFDSDSSGTHASCASSTSLKAFAASARARGYKALLGESAFGNYKGVPASCVKTGAQAISEIKAAPDVFYGVTWWGGGPGWSENYLFKIEPKKGTRSSAARSAYLKEITGR